VSSKNKAVFFQDNKAKKILPYQGHQLSSSSVLFNPIPHPNLSIK
jgi:hypothetical protein